MSTKTGGDLKLTKPAYGEKADVNVINTNMETIDTNFTSMFNNLNDKAEYVRLVSTDDSWAAVWTKLSAIKQAYTHLIYISTTPFDVLAGTSGTSVSYSGTVLKTSTGKARCACSKGR